MSDLRERIHDLERQAEALKRSTADFRRCIEELEQKAAEYALLARLAMHPEARTQSVPLSDDLLVVAVRTRGKLDTGASDYTRSVADCCRA